MVQKRTLGRRLIKWVAILLGSLVFLVLLIVVLVQTPYGQGIVKNQAEKYLRNKLQTRFAVGHLKINFLSGIHLSNLYLEDRQRKELLSIDRLDVSYDFSALFRKSIILKEINLKGVSINLARDSSSEKFNYDFITEAFASSDTTATDDSSGFSFHLGKVILDSIHFNMTDAFGGQFYVVDLPRFRSDITSSDVGKLQFKANYVMSDGLNCSILIKETGKTEERVMDTIDVTTPFRIIADTVAINKTVFRFANKADQTEISTLIGNLSGRMVDYRSENLSASASLIAIKDHSTEINIKTGKTPREEKKEVKLVTPVTFTFHADTVAVEKNKIVFNDNAHPKINARAIDYNHIGIEQLNFHVSDLGYNGKTYAGRIHDFTVNETSGFAVRELNGEVSYSDSAIVLKKILLKTKQNDLNIDANVLTIPGIKANEKNYRINAAMNTRALRLGELLYLQPDLAANKYFAPLAGKSIQLSTQVNGTLDNLHIPRLLIREGANRISATADVLNLPDTKRMIINLRLNEFISTREGMLSYLPAGTIPDSLLHYIPETFSVKGTYKGSMENMYADLQLISSDGNATIKGTLKNVTDTKNAVYDMVVSTDNIDLEKLLADTTMGKITARVAAKGRGFDIRSAVADFDVHVDEAFYNGYTYRQVDLKGKVNKNTIDASLNSQDPNADISGDVFLNLNPGQRGFRTNTDIKHIDLQALGFSSDSIQLRSVVTADFPLTDSNGMEGKMLIRDTYVTLNGKPIAIDTMTLEAVHVADSQSLVFRSPLADLSVVGNYNLPALGPAFRTISHNYLSTTGTDTVFTTDVRAEYMASFYIPDSIISLIPGVKSVDPFYVVGNIDTKNNLLKLFSSISSVKMATMEIDTINIAFVTQEAGQKYDDMRYAISISTLTGASYEMKASTVQGGIKRGVIDGLMRLEDDKAKPRYLVPFVYTNDSLRPNIRIGDSLMINKKYWSVNKENIIYLNTKQLASSNLILKDRNTLVELKAADSNETGLPITLNIKEFNIKDVAELVITDTAMASGMVNGNMSISSFEPLTFTTHLSVDSLTLMKAKLGTIKADVEQKDEGVLAVNTSLKGGKNDITLNGSFKTKTSEPDLQLDINQFDLSSVQPILYNYLGELNGYLKGNLKITGNLDKPVLNGVVNYRFSAGDICDDRYLYPYP